MFPCVPPFQFLFPLWSRRLGAIGIKLLRVCGKHLTEKTNLFRQKYLRFSRYAENQMHNGTVSGKGGFSLVSVYCSEIHFCARKNVTVMSNVTEVPGKCKFWVTVVPYLLWNRITVLRKVENLLQKRVFSSLASIIHFDMLKVEKKKRRLAHQEHITSLYQLCWRTFYMSKICYIAFR